MKLKIARSHLVEDQAESVQTPKWAGWLLDTPHAPQAVEEAAAGAKNPERSCPVCGRSSPKKRDVEIQCTLLQ